MCLSVFYDFTDCFLYCLFSCMLVQSKFLDSMMHITTSPEYILLGIDPDGKPERHGLWTGGIRVPVPFSNVYDLGVVKVCNSKSPMRSEGKDHIHNFERGGAYFCYGREKVRVHLEATEMEKEVYTTDINDLNKKQQTKF